MYASVFKPECCISVRSDALITSRSNYVYFTPVKQYYYDIYNRRKLK